MNYDDCGTCDGFGGVESGLPAYPDRIVRCPECEERDDEQALALTNLIHGTQPSAAE